MNFSVNKANYLLHFSYSFVAVHSFASCSACFENTREIEEMCLPIWAMIMAN
jgi:hypothetical protein